MVNEIKWWCKFLSIPYKNSDTLELWKIKKQRYIKKDTAKTNITINNDHNKQLTIFDFEAQTAI